MKNRTRLTSVSCTIYLLYMAQDRLLIEQKAIRNNKKIRRKENGRTPKQGRLISGGSGRTSVHGAVGAVGSVGSVNPCESYLFIPVWTPTYKIYRRNRKKKKCSIENLQRNSILWWILNQEIIECRKYIIIDNWTIGLSRFFQDFVRESLVCVS